MNYRITDFRFYCIFRKCLNFGLYFSGWFHQWLVSFENTWTSPHTFCQNVQQNKHHKWKWSIFPAHLLFHSAVQVTYPSVNSALSRTLSSTLSVHSMGRHWEIKRDKTLCLALFGWARWANIFISGLWPKSPFGHLDSHFRIRNASLCTSSTFTCLNLSSSVDCWPATVLACTGKWFSRAEMFLPSPSQVSECWCLQWLNVGCLSSKCWSLNV